MPDFSFLEDYYHEVQGSSARCLCDIMKKDEPVDQPFCDLGQVR